MGQNNIGEKVGDVKVKALVCTLHHSLAEVEAATPGDTLRNVDAEALAETLADRLKEVKAGKVSETVKERKATSPIVTLTPRWQRYRSRQLAKH